MHPTKTNQKGFSLAVVLIALLVIGLTSGGAWSVFHFRQHDNNPVAQTSGEKDTNKKIAEINSLLKEADVHALHDWSVNPQCGPTDSVEGYAVEQINVKISSEDVDKLQTVASKRSDLQISRTQPGPDNRSYNVTIKNDNWQILAVIYESDDPALFVTIPVKERPSGFPAGQQVCG